MKAQISAPRHSRGWLSSGQRIHRAKLIIVLQRVAKIHMPDPAAVVGASEPARAYHQRQANQRAQPSSVTSDCRNGAEAGRARMVGHRGSIRGVLAEVGQSAPLSCAATGIRPQTSNAFERPRHSCRRKANRDGMAVT